MQDNAIDFSSQQREALEAIKRWLEYGNQQVFRLFGYAGCGKTTLARYFGAMNGNGTQYAAFTGKASFVLRQRGCANAATIHSLIYEPYVKGKKVLNELQDKLVEAKQDKDHREIHRLTQKISLERKNLTQPGFTLRAPEKVLTRSENKIDLFIIDEVSMVGHDMGEDLLSFGIPILVLGDPAQLPPVIGAGFFTDTIPDIMLTQIHRQAEGDPIIDLATHLRLGNEPYDVCDRKDILKQEWIDADQILVGLNRTRHHVNRRMRRWLGYNGTFPNIGEKVICLRNNYDLGIFNGSIWRVIDVDDFDDEVIMMQIYSVEEDRYVECDAHKILFSDPYFYFENMTDRMQANEFDFAYAITTHKAQGSQWNNVIYIDEWPRFDTRKNHRYTGVTRAINKVQIVKW
jgi:exodeoxyribonuclease-5